MKLKDLLYFFSPVPVIIVDSKKEHYEEDEEYAYCGWDENLTDEELLNAEVNEKYRIEIEDGSLMIWIIK